MFLVHDGGKTSSELFCQGVNLTSKKLALQQAIASSYGVTILSTGGVFQKTCSAEELNEAVYSVAQCVSLARLELLELRPDFEDLTVPGKVAKALRAWKPNYTVKLTSNVVVSGLNTKHRFDFVSHPKSDALHTVAIRVLSPNHSAMQAKLYAFMGLDLKRSEAKDWQKLAVVSNPGLWSAPALELVGKFSEGVILLDGGEEDRIDTVVPEEVDRLTRAA
jgi:hypothetical protein